MSVTPTQIPSARDVLRTATGPLHLAVEARFEPLDLTHEGDYGAFLLAHARIVPALEAALDRAGIGVALDDWPRRCRAAALADDLAALGLAHPPPAVVEIAPGAEALGAAYVLEGSRLGAAMLLKAIPDGLPTAFLRHGQRERLFQGFLRHLDALRPEEQAGAVDGARLAFGLFLSDATA